jgi:DNA topoisomerase-1
MASSDPHEVGLEDRRLAHIVRQCRDLPGQKLFQYLDETGRRRDVSSTDVNASLKEIGGADFTAKDFRTWRQAGLRLDEARTLTLLRRCERQPASAKAA